ncbi:MAG: tRNA (N(6)-L-threonylcarbamoyladenosine(37)-C(2))-methylthiotransferase MtaB [Oscillospiraceae bacterium]|jgi:threonylcarbamoyladenosine tRNA methylthiotransferase MtaB|nr:tRNA (N(6)-L-threonylcarbamoyladenosine(37)-C(2))-methylthiotransferase MtaB [Oscillospiraceae bacterium]
MNLNNKKVFAWTQGCKVNQYETQAMLKILEESGCKEVDKEKTADVILINSCTVTTKSDQKLQQNIKRIKKSNPDAVMVLTGCMPQAFPEKALNLPNIDIILGNSKRRDIATKINNFFEKKSKIFGITPHFRTSSFENLEIKHFGKKTRAFLKIEDGCNQFCSYCIVPVARGRVRSKTLRKILIEAKQIASYGHKEIVLTGINLSSYGEDFKNINIMDAIKTVGLVKKIKRIRLSSLEPRIITQEFLDKLQTENKFCDFFHLSLQSGCNRILRAMNRKYTNEEYYRTVEKILDVFPDCSISTDIIVGFPSESEEDFEETLNFARKINFSNIHIFKYSQRKGTAASNFVDDISSQEKSQRSKRLEKLAKELKKNFLKKQLQKEKFVLFESKQNNLFFGYTKNYVKVALKSDKNLQGKILKVLLNGFNDDKKPFLSAKII